MSAVIVLLVVTQVLVSCSGVDPEWGGEIITEEGVPHVYNPDTPLWGLDARPLVERELFGAPDAPEDEIFVSPVAVAVGPDGVRYVLDSRDARIARFDRSGRYLGSFGRSGDGPGEFRAPTDMTLLPDGTLAVVDFELLRLSLFSLDGRFLDSAFLKLTPGQVKARSDGKLYIHGQARQLVVSMNISLSGPEEEPALLDIMTTAGERVAGVGRMEAYEGLMLGQWMNRVYLGVTSGDSLVVNYLARDRMAVYAPDGELARIVHRNLPFEPVEAKEESNVSPDGFISMSFQFDLLSTGLAVSPDGSHWAVVLRVTAADRREGIEEGDEIPQQYAIDLFDRTGRWMGRHPLGEGFGSGVLDWWEDGLYLLNPMGDATIRRFEFEPPGNEL
jgi:hypothetical protein